MCFLQGYKWALIDNQKSEASKYMDRFHDWVAHKLGISESTAGWPNMILAFSLGLDPTPIFWNDFEDLSISQEQHLQPTELFYTLLEEFHSTSTPLNKH